MGNGDIPSNPATRLHIRQPDQSIAQQWRQSAQRPLAGMARIERLECTVKNYAWGKLGLQSEVARLFAAGHLQAQIGHALPYAELWIGTHPDGPALIQAKKVRLSEFIGEQEAADGHLPYIMKVMSIEHTLSLQVHPTKEQAMELNRKDPLNYPDQNHKPELAYALSRFELLCGFRPAAEIVQNMKAFPELCQAMGTANSHHFITLSKTHASDSHKLVEALKKCFTHMMNLDKENVGELVALLFRRLQQLGAQGALREDTVEVMRDMFKRFPNDIGCLSPLYLNHIVLEPGECVYYGAGELHAYLSGECIECVSCSNNTIRAGLTTKFVDRHNLVQVLNYRMADPSFYYVHPQPLPKHPHVKEFAPDCRDFTLHSLDICPAQMAHQNQQFPVDLPALGCSSTFVLVEAQEVICTELNWNGNVLRDGFTAKRGDIFFIPANSTLRFRAATGPVRGFRTFSFEEGPDHSKRVLAADSAVKFGVKKDLLAKRKPKSLDIYDIETEMDGFL